jgi:hypothetical protein
MSAAPHWKELELIRLRDAWKALPTGEAVAAELGRSLSSVYSQAKRIGLPKKRAKAQRSARETVSLRATGAARAAEIQAQWPDRTATRDDLYIAAVEAGGGFHAFTEERRPGGICVVKLPLVPFDPLFRGTAE